MQAVQIIPSPEARGDGTLDYTTLPLPPPKPHEVLIRVHASGLNRADIFQRQGRYPPPKGASPLPGLEVAGNIIALGEAVTGWCVGDAVCALLPGGGYAEYATAHAGHVMKVPEGWEMDEAAALPEALLTVWMALHVKAGMQKGESVLIHGGASGIGMIATQYAAWLGATVFTTASTAEKCAASAAWGAHHAINYTKQDFAEAVQHHTNGNGVNVVLDMVGGDYISKNLQCLAKEGRMISLAFLRGAKTDASLGALLLKNIHWMGATLRSQPDETKAAWLESARTVLAEPLRHKHICPQIYCHFDLKDAKKAHETMEQNLNLGKIVLQV